MIGNYWAVCGQCFYFINEESGKKMGGRLITAYDGPCEVCEKQKATHYVPRDIIGEINIVNSNQCTFCKGNGCVVTYKGDSISKCRACDGTGLKPWARKSYPVHGDVTLTDSLGSTTMVFCESELSINSIERMLKFRSIPDDSTILIGPEKKKALHLYYNEVDNTLTIS